MANSPQIGTYTPQESAEGAMPRRATPELSGVSTGRAFEEAGGAIQQVAHQNGAVHATATMGDARATFTQRLLDAQNNYKPGDDVVGTIGKEFKAYRDEALKQASFNPYAKQFLTEQMAEFGSQLTSAAMRFQAEAQVNDRIQRQQDGTKKATIAVGLDPGQYASARAEQLTGISQLQVDPKDKARLANEATSDMAWSASLKLATDHPDDVLAALQKPDAGHPALNDLTEQQRTELTRFATAQSNDIKKQNEEHFVEGSASSVLDIYRTAGPGAGAKAYQAIDSSNMSDELKDKVRTKVAAGINQLHEESRQVHGQTIAALEERISNGTANEQDRATANWLYHKNAYSGDQLGSALGGIDRAEKEKVKDGLSVQAAEDAYAKGTPLPPDDPDVKKGVDKFFQTVTQNAPQGTPEWANRAIDISLKTGVIPKSSSEWALANLVSGKPEQAASAAMLIQRFGETNPRGLGYAVGEPERAMAAQIADVVTAGGDPVSAVTMARENAKLSTTQRQVLDDRWKTQTGFAFGKQTAAIDSSAIRKGLSDDPHYNPPGLFSGSVPQPPDQMSAEYAHLVRDYWYHTNGNMDQAQRLAIQDLKSTWGVTEVNGQRELMKYAPERMFPGLTPKAIQANITSTLFGLKVEANGAPKLAESTGTQNSPSTAASGGRVWNIMVPDRFGAYEPVRGKDGTPIAYQLPEVDREGDQYRADIARETQDKVDLAKLSQEQARRAQLRTIGSVF